MFGHILRHPEEISHKVCIRPMGDPRILRNTIRIGRPRLHWVEMCYVEAYRKIELLQQTSLPRIIPITHDFFRTVNTDEQNEVLGPHMHLRSNMTKVTKTVSQAAFEPDIWKFISKPK